MAKITGLEHAGITVADLDRTLAFYVDKLGGKLISELTHKGADLGTSVLGRNAQPYAAIRTAVVQLGGIQVVFLQYLDPKTAPYHGNPSVAGSVHLAFIVDNIQEMYERLSAQGVSFNTVVKDNIRDGVLIWKWVYMTDPDGICCELIQPFGKQRDSREA